MRNFMELSLKFWKFEVFPNFLYLAFAQNWVNPHNAMSALETAGSCSSLRSGRVGTRTGGLPLRPNSLFFCVIRSEPGKSVFPFLTFTPTERTGAAGGVAEVLREETASFTRPVRRDGRVLQIGVGVKGLGCGMRVA
jgi:hypothetical protein